MVAVTTLTLIILLTQNIVICYPNHTNAKVNQDLSRDCQLRLGNYSDGSW